MAFDPSTEIQDFLVFGEFGGVNPSITDSCTYTFLDTNLMEKTFSGEEKGCFLYSRHWCPSNRFLATALSRMEGTEDAKVTASGLSAVTCTLLNLCSQGDHIVCSRTIYGGTYALLKNVLPRFGITTTFVDIKNIAQTKNAIQENTKLVYCETVSNPLLEVANLPELKKITSAAKIPLVVDNTFTPLIFSPAKMGADMVIYSMTKFINGASDCVAGAVCTTKKMVEDLVNPNSGVFMLTGPVLDSMRSASILKNLHTLHIRMKQHSKNALHVANYLHNLGLKVHYPGLESHPDHEIFKSLCNPEFGFGGMMVLDAGTLEKAQKLVLEMQNEKVGYFAVSLGFYKTLFSIPGTSTSSEIPEKEQKEMGLGEGLVRFSIGLDHHIEIGARRIEAAAKKVGIL